MSDKNEKPYKAPFYDSNTKASNPGNLTVNPFQWIKMNFMQVALIILLMGLGFFGMINIHWTFGILFVAAVLYNVWYWFNTINKFKAGDVNPGKVISINPDRVAVATNMSKYGGDFPILKIFKTKLPAFEKEVGLMIPTVALYFDNPYEYPFWAEFKPVPISHGVSDKADLQARFSTFKKSDFETLENYLKQVDTNQLGTFKVNVEDSEWKDYPDVEIGSISKMKGPE
jgi:hypothetical protein